MCLLYKFISRIFFFCHRLRDDYFVLVSETSATPLHDPGSLLVISLLSLGLVVSLLRLSQDQNSRSLALAA